MKRFELKFTLWLLVVFCNDDKSSNYDRFSLKLDDAAMEKEKELRQKRVRFSVTIKLTFFVYEAIFNLYKRTLC